MTDLKAFCAAMNGEWRVERYELTEGDLLRVHYRSLADPAVTWSHLPLNDLDDVAPVGTVGRIGFQWDREGARR